MSEPTNAAIIARRMTPNINERRCSPNAADVPTPERFADPPLSLVSLLRKRLLGIDMNPTASRIHDRRPWWSSLLPARIFAIALPPAI